MDMLLKNMTDEEILELKPLLHIIHENMTKKIKYKYYWNLHDY